MKGILAVFLWAMGMGAVLPQEGKVPSDLLAKDPLVDLIRQAMRQPEQEEVWSRLHQSLQAFSQRGTEESEPAPQGTYLAERSGGENPPEGTRAAPGIGDLRRALPALVGLVRAEEGSWALGVLITLAILILLGRRRARTRGGRGVGRAGLERGGLSAGGDHTASSRMRTSPDGSKETLGRREGERMGGARGEGERPWSFAVALCRSGVPTHEVARRTGLAQDALKVLLALREAPWSPEKAAEGGR